MIKYFKIKYLFAGIFLLTGIFFNACKEIEYSEENVLVSLHGNSLKFDYVRDFMPDGLSNEDSLLFFRNFIDNWIIDELLYYKAKNELKDTFDIQLKIEDYRKELYTYKYLDQKVYSKINRYVSKDQIQEYYNNNLKDLVLKEAFIKAHYIVMPLNTTYYRERTMIMNTSPEDYEKLIEFCEGTNRRVHFINEWTNLDNFLRRICFHDYYNPDRLRFERLIESMDEDNELRYLVRINDYRLRGENIPVELIEDNIIEIILNKRRREVLEQKKKELIAESRRLGYIHEDL